MLGLVYHQGRDDVWAMTPRELHGYLEDWARREQAASQAR